MPRYYFHLHNDFTAIDDEGRELADLAAARRAAEEAAREMAGRSVQSDGRLNLAHYVEVTDESGRPVMRVRFGDAVAVAGQDRAHASAGGPDPD